MRRSPSSTSPDGTATPGGVAKRGARRRERFPLPLVLSACAVLLVVVMTLGVGVGSVSLSPGAVWQVVVDHLDGHPPATVADAIVWQIRLPRVLLAAVVGAALTSAGTVVQVQVRNALADPFLLGISSGAGVGATLVLLFGAFASLGVWALSLGSVLGSLAAMASVFLLARRQLQLAPTQLILCGVVLSALFDSVTSFLIFKGNPHATQSVLFWLMGSFGQATWSQLPIPALVLLGAMLYLIAQGRALNALAMGAEAAASLGVDVRAMRRNLFLVTSAMAGVSVAVSGVIGFVGLVVPHIVRLLVGSDHRRTLPAGVLFGASFMVLGDLLRAHRRGSPGDADRGDHRLHRRAGADRVDPSSPLPLRSRFVSLELVGLSVDIAGRRIVSDVDLVVPHGHVVGLLGPNGSGKSTLLKTVYRVNRPAAGRVLVDGEDLLALRPRNAARRIAVIAQESTVEFDFTVTEDGMMIGRTPHKRAFDRDDRADRAAVEQAIERVGCAHLSERSFNTLSGGEKQRVLIARAIAQDDDET